MIRYLSALTVATLVSFAALANMLVSPPPFNVTTSPAVLKQILWACSPSSQQIAGCTTSVAPTTGTLVSNYTVVSKVAAAALGSAFGTISNIQLRLMGPTGSNAVKIANIYVGPSATSGSGHCGSGGTTFCSWDFAATPTQITFGGSNGVTINASGSSPNTISISDLVSFTPAAGPLTVCFNLNSSGPMVFFSPTATSVIPNSSYATTNYNAWYISGHQECSTLSKVSGYTGRTSPTLHFVQAIYGL